MTEACPPWRACRRAIPAAQLEAALLIPEIVHPDHRHAAWLQEIEQGSFSFGAEKLTLVLEGEGSWEHAALGAPHDGKHHYDESFLRSDWKRFHDALILHRYDVIYRILPRYGICTA